jgi:hypothetical protein
MKRTAHRDPRRLALLCAATCVTYLPPRLAAEDYRNLDPARLVQRLDELFTDPEAGTMRYWQAKPPLAATFAYPRQVSVSPADREAVRHFVDGEFRPSQHFEWKPLGVPPPWDDNPFDNGTFDFYRHSLRWMLPLIHQWASGQDEDALDLALKCMQDWIQCNSTPPGASAYAWDDHAASYRLRIFCWFWELWRQSDRLDPDLARLLLASIYQHATFMTDEREYHPTSNHALHMDGSLLAAAVTCPEFKASARWRGLAEQRLTAYVERNFSPEGFNLEQSPSYHWYVLDKLGETVEFLRANDQLPPPALLRTLKDGIGVWPYLIRPDGAVPNVGDSGHKAGSYWQKRARQFLGEAPPPAAPLTMQSPRPDAGSFLLSFQAGYAIFTSFPLGQARPESDTYALFRCNSWPHSGHCHCDALSFELYGLGREWLVDSGKLNYETNSPERRYMLSARAHNVVLIDEQDFKFHPVELVDQGRTDAGDFVAARHVLPLAQHTRRFEFLPPRTVLLTDQLGSSDGQAHVYTQLFHIAPGLGVEIVSPRLVRLKATDGATGLIEQTGDSGTWTLVTGQREPFLQGWYSRRFNEMEPSPVLCFTTARPVERCVFVTQITLQPKRNPSTQRPVTPEHLGPEQSERQPRCLPLVSLNLRDRAVAKKALFADQHAAQPQPWHFRQPS